MQTYKKSTKIETGKKKGGARRCQPPIGKGMTGRYEEGKKENVYEERLGRSKPSSVIKPSLSLSDSVLTMGK